MNAKLGCVLAIRNYPFEVLERTLQTYTFQTLRPLDQVLLDYGSHADLADTYRQLGQRYGWRVVTVTPSPAGWHLSDAYNRAVAALHPDVELVFKSDADVLLGQDVLEMAAVLGRQQLCLFSLLTTQANATYPSTIRDHRDVIGLLGATPAPTPMPSEGTLACPRTWFTRMGGFDRRYQGWGFEDSDLRERAKATIGVREVNNGLLIHQGHEPAICAEQATRNRAYYEQMKQGGPVVRNGGVLVDNPEKPDELVADPASLILRSKGERLGRIAVATRSMTPELYQLSGELLCLEDLGARTGQPWPRHGLTDTNALDYFRRLVDLDADWVVNIDEDAFLLRPHSLVELIQHMNAQGYAVCGMPDGGVVPIRRHHPAACNAFFNIFDLRRVRTVWADWNRVLAAVPRAAYADVVAPFARRSTSAFDHFERYYGVFFTLLDAGERFLYLDADEWQDGITTLLKGVDGEPMLLHCWYSRYWNSSHHTRQRYRTAFAYARSAQRSNPR